MNMGCTASIMTGEKSFEFDYSIIVTLLDTTEEGIVDVCSIRRVSISVGNNTGVHALYSQTHVRFRMLAEDIQWSCSARCRCMTEAQVRMCLSQLFGCRGKEVPRSGLR
jgi:hypothetical protein